MTEDPAAGHGRHVALQNVQVRTADGDGIDTDDRVGVIADYRLRRFFPGLPARSVIDEGSHLLLLPTRRGSFVSLAAAVCAAAGP